MLLPESGPRPDPQALQEKDTVAKWLLLPVLAYGTGYISGKSIRTRIHTAISENEKKRIRRDKRKRKSQNRPSHRREPEQLN